MNNAHHWGWMIVALIALGAITYVFTLNRPDLYKGNAIHAEQHRQDWPLSIHIGEGGCARLTPNMKDTKSDANSQAGNLINR